MWSQLNVYIKIIKDWYGISLQKKAVEQSSLNKTRGGGIEKIKLPANNLTLFRSRAKIYKLFWFYFSASTPYTSKGKPLSALFTFQEFKLVTATMKYILYL